MFERYTEKARRTIFFARYETSALGESRITPIHLLLGMMREDKALFLRLQLQEGRLDSLRDACVKDAPGGKPVSTSVDLPLDEPAKEIIYRAAMEADLRKESHVHVEHLFLATLHVPSKAKDILKKHGLTYSRVSALLRSGGTPLGDSLDYT